MARTIYAVALGSNRRGRHGAPAAEVRAALALLDPIAIAPIVTSAPVAELRAALALLEPVAVAPIVASAPLGPSHRRYANTVALVASDDPPPALLARLQAIERAFGRRSGRRWGARVLDLDIVLWSGGQWASPGLAIPHPAFRGRRFVLDPLVALVPAWRDPATGLTVRQLAARLTRRAPLP